MRLFLAIYPSKETLDSLRDALRRFDKQKRNLKNTPVDQMHITLKFLGPIVTEYSKDLLMNELRGLEGSFGEIDVNPKKISFGFEKEHYPKYLITNVERSDKLVNLTTAIHDVVRSLKLRDTIRFKRRYQFNYHITLSRIKLTSTKSTGHMIKHIAEELSDFKIPSFKADRLFLVESVTGESGGPIYKKLDSILL